MNPLKPATDIIEGLLFPLKALGILAICALVNVMTSPGHWWVQWVAMGLAIAVIVKLGRAIKSLIVAGTLTALAVVAWRWWKSRRMHNA